MQLIAKSGDLAVIRLNPLDNVLIARQALPEGLHLDAEAITCLLYTSPSPRDGLLSRMPSSA